MTDQRETADAGNVVIGSFFDRGYVQVYTGDGKGKTTAAIGLAIRALGAGLNVYFAQFIKCGRYSEIEALDRFSDRLTCRQFGRGNWLAGEPGSEDRQSAEDCLNAIADVLKSGKHQLVILDEANVAAYYGLIDADALLRLIDIKPRNVELVITGRCADRRIIERADLVTEMWEVKHYYKDGVLGRKGIES